MTGCKLERLSTMHSLNTGAISETVREVGALLPFDRSATEPSLNLYTADPNNLPPLVSGEAFQSGLIPSLPVARVFDSADLLTTLLALKIKMTDGLVAGGMADIRACEAQQRQLHERVAENIRDAAKSLARSEQSSGAMKLLGWLAVGLSVVAAVGTGGALAAVAAAVTGGVAVLSETGVVDKMTEAMATSLMEHCGMDSAEANRVAMGISIGIVFAVSVLAGGAGFAANASANGLSGAAMLRHLGERGASTLRGLASLASNPGSLGAMISKVITQAASALAEGTSNPATIVRISQSVSTAAQAGQAVASLAEGCAGITSGVQQKKATDAQAKALDTGERIAWYKQLQDDGMDFIKQLLLDRKETTEKAVEAVERQIDLNAKLSRHFG
ncbi:type III secretion system translocon subunit SctE [Bradyrhizobium sp. CB3481]|uniref:type III secretion system translocon subunit SctE n=1 Tax=Bradyrhizobium sp. CB3481 TaxID=3039158 RepID=UPI0024B12373|nr:type III secretion system translocon subunit SctE [Bradyrhizobium sp. CB3481]WFU14899.1 type III secretion system translocon subunit SctE [Bradyrhizobium sp. CB3481]